MEGLGGVSGGMQRHVVLYRRGGIDVITLQRFVEEFLVDEFLPLLQNYIRRTNP